MDSYYGAYNAGVIFRVNIFFQKKLQAFNKMALMQQMEIFTWTVSQHVLLITSVGRPLIDRVFLGILVSGSPHINVDLAQNWITQI